MWSGSGSYAVYASEWGAVKTDMVLRELQVDTVGHAGIARAVGYSLLSPPTQPQVLVSRDYYQLSHLSQVMCNTICVWRRWDVCVRPPTVSCLYPNLPPVNYLCMSHTQTAMYSYKDVVIQYTCIAAEVPWCNDYNTHSSWSNTLSMTPSLFITIMKV